jgi:hypothetical protein
MGINTVGGCDCRCGSCEDCCGGVDIPNEYDVDISWTDSDCGYCDGGMSGTYVLESVVGCGWSGQFSVFPSQACGTYNFIASYVFLSILCSGGNYVVTLTATNEYRDFSNPYTGGCSSTPAGYFIETHTWSKTIAAADYVCSTDSLDLDYVGRECQCGNNAGPYAACSPDVVDCVAPATVTIVPVP